MARRPDLAKVAVAHLRIPGALGAVGFDTALRATQPAAHLDAWTNIRRCLFCRSLQYPSASSGHRTAYGGTQGAARCPGFAVA
jgi:hypothetical protein